MEIDTLLDAKKNADTFDALIQNDTGLTAISCDNDLRISITSNGNKLCDIEEDEINQGMTVATGAKRFNLVSGAPQTFYHNSPAGLFNFKYTDDGSLTPGEVRFGQLQLAPSNTTTINPAINLISSRVNGLGTAAVVCSDSDYGSVAVPLIVAPQSVTDADFNGLYMYRNGLSQIPIKNQFTGRTGLSFQ